MKFITRNVGCKVNAYELAAITSLLIKAGHKIGGEAHFDFAVINTCTVTQVASQKSRQHIRKLRLLNPHAIIVVTGCYVTLNHERIIKECGADIVVGVNERKKIPQLLKRREKQIVVKASSLKELRTNANYEELGVHPYTERTRAYVKISDGCNNFCSYCIIPFVRGRLRSRSPQAIFKEIASLLKMGYQEIVLTGIDTTSYSQEYDNYHFSNLLEDILKRFPTLYRLRISSIEISKVDQKFLALLKEYPNIANHLHISLQSGSDTVLKRMNRKYTTREFANKVALIRKARPDIAITTDVIVGFPNESIKEFNETYRFIKKMKFMELHVFPFSPREGTAAIRYPEISTVIKKERVHRLLELSKSLKKKYEQQFIGQKLSVLFEKNNEGLTSNYLRIRAKAKPNAIKIIKLTKLNIIEH